MPVAEFREFIWLPHIRATDFLHLLNRARLATLIRDPPSKRPFTMARTIWADQLLATKWSQLWICLSAAAKIVYP
jgi:hypothetical protein